MRPVFCLVAVSQLRTAQPLHISLGSRIAQLLCTALAVGFFFCLSHWCEGGCGSGPSATLPVGATPVAKHGLAGVFLRAAAFPKLQLMGTTPSRGVKSST